MLTVCSDVPLTKSTSQRLSVPIQTALFRAGLTLHPDGSAEAEPAALMHKCCSEVMPLLQSPLWKDEFSTSLHAVLAETTAQEAVTPDSGETLTVSTGTNVTNAVMVRAELPVLVA